MSYCTRAVCLAHRQDCYINIQWREWVHASGWPCEALADAPITADDLS